MKRPKPWKMSDEELERASTRQWNRANKWLQELEMQFELGRREPTGFSNTPANGVGWRGGIQKPLRKAAEAAQAWWEIEQEYDKRRRENRT